MVASRGGWLFFQRVQRQQQRECEHEFSHEHEHPALALIHIRQTE
jgi:hypothetical protein